MSKLYLLKKPYPSSSSPNPTSDRHHLPTSRDHSSRSSPQSASGLSLAATRSFEGGVWELYSLIQVEVSILQHICTFACLDCYRESMDTFVDVHLPLDKLSVLPIEEAGPSKTPTRSRVREFVVLVSSGSFNPPTYMHLRMFELAKDALKAEGYCVIGGYMSPVNDAYRKKGLLSAIHRIRLCELASRGSSFVMVDPWEAKQDSYQRTLTVLSRIRSSLIKSGLINKESFRVMLLCGSDLLDSFSIPGVWVRDQVRTICEEFGIVCIRREGKDIEKIISNDDILNANKSNIFAVDEVVPNQISSTKVRECIQMGLSVKYLTPDEVIDYIRDHLLYLGEPSDK